MMGCLLGFLHFSAIAFATLSIGAYFSTPVTAIAQEAAAPTTGKGCPPEAVFRNLESHWFRSLNSGRGPTTGRRIASQRELLAALTQTLGSVQNLAPSQMSSFLDGLGDLKSFHPSDFSILDQLVRELPPDALQGPTDRQVSGRLLRTMLDYHRPIPGNPSYLDPRQAARFIRDFSPVEKAGLLKTYLRASEIEAQAGTKGAMRRIKSGAERAAALEAALREEKIPDRLVKKGSACASSIAGGAL